MRHHEQQEEEQDFVYGRWPVKELLDVGRASKILFSTGSRGGIIDEIMALARKANVPYVFVDRQKLDTLAGEKHQGIVAYMRAKPPATLEDVWAAAASAAGAAKASKGPAILFLDGIMDPQNLGALLRSAYYFGIPAVVIPKWRAASLTGAVVRASAGAAHLLPVAQVSNLATTLEMAKKKGFWIVGADMGGGDVKTIDIPRPFALVMGSEGPGLHELVRKKCDIIVAIRRLATDPGIDSLNVSAACAVLLHHLS